jgi:hypothetical protein
MIDRLLHAKFEFLNIVNTLCGFTLLTVSDWESLSRILLCVFQMGAGVYGIYIAHKKLKTKK